MPLFIPVVLGGAALIAGGTGVKKGYDGVGALREARSVGKRAEAKLKRHEGRLESARRRVEQRIGDYNDLRAAVREDTFARLFEFLARLDHVGRERALASLGDLSEREEGLQAFAQRSIEAGKTTMGAVTAVSAGVGAQGLATSAATGIGVASTGTAISGLSGAAAQSATLAWLGGGSLATGGGGMALGSVVLGGVAVGPALAVGGFVLASQGAKSLTAAVEYEAEVDKACAKMRAGVSGLQRIERHLKQVGGVVEALDGRASDLLTELERIKDFDALRDDHSTRFQMVMLLCKSLSDIFATSIVTAAGAVNPSSEEIVARVADVGSTHDE